MAIVLTDAGEALLADIFDGTTAVPSNWYIGWGTGAGTAAKGNTTLFTEASESRVAATMSQPVADKNRLVSTIVADGNKTITNAGFLSASTAGTIVVKTDFTGVALLTGESIELTFEVEWA